MPCCLHASSPCSCRQYWVISALSFASIFNNQPNYPSTRRYMIMIFSMVVGSLGRGILGCVSMMHIVDEVEERGAKLVPTS